MESGVTCPFTRRNRIGYINESVVFPWTRSIEATRELGVRQAGGGVLGSSPAGSSSGEVRIRVPTFFL